MFLNCWKVLVIGENIGEWVEENSIIFFEFLIGVEMRFLIRLNLFVIDLFLLLVANGGVNIFLFSLGVIFFLKILFEDLRGDCGVGL